MEQIFRQNYKTIYVPKRGTYEQTITTAQTVTQNIYVTHNQCFTTKFKDIFSGYESYYIVNDNRKKDEKLLNEWTSDPLKLYQSQINLATHIATTMCGISQQHLTHKSNILRSVYMFHNYYQIRKIMKYLRIKLCGDEGRF